MTDKHLLWWMFKASERRLTEEDFKRINAPHWAWPAYQEALSEYNHEHIEALESALREIANLRYSNTSAAEIARAALDKDAGK